MYYFGYGSNMSKARLENQKRQERKIGDVIDKGMCSLANHKIDFSKKSTINNSGKTNIRPTDGKEVLGVLFEMTEDQISLLTSIEGGYKREDVTVSLNNQVVQAVTYIAKPESVVEGLLPTKEYLGYLITGAKEHNFPAEYIAMLENQQCLPEEPIIV